MFFRQIQLGPMQNFYYLIGCEESKECAVIDCGFEHEQLLDIVQKEGYRITKIFLTHFHYDHSQEVDALVAKTGAEVFGHVGGAEKRGGGNWVVPERYTTVEDGDTVQIGSIAGKVIHTPGHQSDHLSYVFEEHFLTGDSIFIDAVARTDLPDSEPEQMEQTLELIKTLPDEWMVYPGHDYGEVAFRRLGEEKVENSFLKKQSLI